MKNAVARTVGALGQCALGLETGALTGAITGARTGAGKYIIS